MGYPSEGTTITDVVRNAHANAVEKGWWKNNTFNIPEKLALIHSEVSEALEAYRDNEMVTYFNSPNKKPLGFPSELADIVIRIADLCGRMGINLEYEVDLKMDYNRTRSFRHGGKKA